VCQGQREDRAARKGHEHGCRQLSGGGEEVNQKKGTRNAMIGSGEGTKMARRSRERFASETLRAKVGVAGADQKVESGGI